MADEIERERFAIERERIESFDKHAAAMAEFYGMTLTEYEDHMYWQSRIQERNFLNSLKKDNENE